MQRFDFKNILICIKWFLVMILNLYSTSQVRFCGGCALKLKYYHLNSSEEGF